MAIQWALVIFTLLASCAAATMIFIGLAEITGKAKNACFISSIVAAILLVAGGIASITHLGNPINVMSAITNIFSFSGISLELLFLGLSFVCVVIYAIVCKRGAAVAAKVFGIIGLVFGLGLCIVLGTTYLIAARPAWDNVGMPLASLGSGLAMGGFLFVIIAKLTKTEEKDLKAVGLWVIIAAAIALITYLIFGFLSGAATSSSQAVLFWLVAVVIGTVIPLICAIILMRSTKMAYFAYIGLVGAIAGTVGFRAVMWLVGSGIVDIFAHGNMRIPF